jgi:hypothetical protein
MDTGTGLGALAGAVQAGGADTASPAVMLVLLAHSVGLGSLLVLVTFFQMKYLNRYQAPSLFELEEGGDRGGPDGAAGAPLAPAAPAAPPGAPGPASRPAAKDGAGEETDSTTGLFLGSANLLFLCVGLTSIMLMVNYNLVRAFAIVAAIALVRFRIKLDQKSLNSTLLFGILAGMACGLGEVALAWLVVGVYVLLLGLVLLVVAALSRWAAPADRRRAAAPPAPPVLGAPPAPVGLAGPSERVAP